MEHKQIYKFDKKIFSTLQPSAVELLECEFGLKDETSQINSLSKNNKYIELEYTDKNYTCHDKINKIINSDIQAISFFSGAGGLDIGAQLAGVKVISSLDFEKQAVETMKANKYFTHTKHICEDISNITANDYTEVIKKNKPKKLLLIGGPPCQPFSKAGYWITNKNRKASEDPRNMIGQYIRMIDELKPDGFLLENVESILHPTNKNAVENLENAIKQMGYYFVMIKANSADYGVPQKRKRVFFIASKNEIKIDIKKLNGLEKERSVNSDLLAYDNVLNWIAKYDIDKYFEKEEVTTNKTYSNELYAVPPGKNYISLTEKAGYPNPKFIANKRFWSFLLKLHPYLPSWTISASPGPWVGPFHWSGRRLRVREAASIQTFPEDYIFTGSRRNIQKQIGNAVPPLLGKAMVEYLVKCL